MPNRLPRLIGETNQVKDGTRNKTLRVVRQNSDQVRIKAFVGSRHPLAGQEILISNSQIDALIKLLEASKTTPS